MNKKKILCRVLLITMMVIIFIFSNQDGNQSTNLSNFFARIFNIYGDQGTEPSAIKLLFGLTIRKYAHIFVYFLLGMFAFGSLYEKENMWTRPIIAIIICYSYAAIDEFHQYFVPGRAGRFTDTLIDAIGFVTAIVICRLGGVLYRGRIAANAKN